MKPAMGSIGGQLSNWHNKISYLEFGRLVQIQSFRLKLNRTCPKFWSKIVTKLPCSRSFPITSREQAIAFDPSKSTCSSSPPPQCQCRSTQPPSPPVKKETCPKPNARLFLHYFDLNGAALWGVLFTAHHEITTKGATKTALTVFSTPAIRKN